jgi:hypothetical protein
MLAVTPASPMTNSAPLVRSYDVPAGVLLVSAGTRFPRVNKTPNNVRAQQTRPDDQSQMDPEGGNATRPDTTSAVSIRA